MSANNSAHLSIPIHIFAAFAVGSAAMAGSGAALASMMASRGLGLSAAPPLATAAACAGSLVGGWLLAVLRKSRGLLWGGMVGLVYALVLLGLQLYTGNGLDQDGKSGHYGPHAGFCLETQFIPNAVNCPSYALHGDPVYDKNRLYRFTTAYKFVRK